MGETQHARRRNADAIISRAPSTLAQDCGVVLGDQPTDPAQFPEFYRQRAVWRRFSPAATDAALLLDTPDDSLPYVLADNVLQHCPRLSVALTNWIRAVKPGG